MIEIAQSILLLPHLAVHVKREWGSKNQNYRNVIRTAIADLHPSAPSVNDLSQLPEIPGFEVSISHTQGIGGFAITPGDLPIGFDIELTARVNHSQLERVSRYQDEVKLCPRADFLWTAKEAAFKAVAQARSLRVLADVRVEQWTKLAEQTWLFESESFVGISFIQNEFTVAVVRARTRT